MAETIREAMFALHGPFSDRQSFEELLAAVRVPLAEWVLARAERRRADG